MGKKSSRFHSIIDYESVYEFIEDVMTEQGMSSGSRFRGLPPITDDHPDISEFEETRNHEEIALPQDEDEEEEFEQFLIEKDEL